MVQRHHCRPHLWECMVLLDSRLVVHCDQQSARQPTCRDRSGTSWWKASTDVIPGNIHPMTPFRAFGVKKWIESDQIRLLTHTPLILILLIGYWRDWIIFCVENIIKWPLRTPDRPSSFALGVFRSISVTGFETIPNVSW